MNQHLPAWKRNLLILSVSQFFVMACMSSIVPFLPLYIRQLGVTDKDSIAIWSGWTFAAPFLISFFVTPYWGVLGDRHGRKLMTVRAILGLAVSLILLGLSQNVWQLFIFRLLQGLLSGFYPANLALAAAQSPKEKTGHALASVQAAYTAGYTVGPLFGGLLADVFGYRWVNILSGGVTLILSVIIIVYVKEVNSENKAGENGNIRENLKLFFTTPGLWITGIFITGTAFAESFLRPIFVLYIESFKINSSIISTYAGALLSITGISAAFSGIFFGKRIENKRVIKILILVLAGTALFQAMQALAPQPWILFPIRFSLGFFYGLTFPLLFTLIILQSPSFRKSGMMGIASSFQTLGNFGGPMLSGYLTTLIGFRGAFISSGIMFVLLTLGAVFTKKHILIEQK